MHGVTKAVQKPEEANVSRRLQRFFVAVLLVLCGCAEPVQIQGRWVSNGESNLQKSELKHLIDLRLEQQDARIQGEYFTRGLYGRVTGSVSGDHIHLELEKPTHRQTKETDLDQPGLSAVNRLEPLIGDEDVPETFDLRKQGDILAGYWTADPNKTVGNPRVWYRRWRKPSFSWEEWEKG